MTFRDETSERSGSGFARFAKRGFAEAFVFSGRLSKRDYWLYLGFWLLFAFAVSLPLGVIDSMTRVEGVTGITWPTLTIGAYSKDLPSAVVALLTLSVSLSLLARRLHDRNHSGWWGLVYYLAPVVGAMLSLAATDGPAALWGAILAGERLSFTPDGTALSLLAMAVAACLVLFCFVQTVLPGTRGPNRFGPPPREVRG